jgi:hypothetical protein
MSETTLRLLVLSGVAVVVLIAWWIARPDRARPIATRRPDLAPGVYFFSSDTCGACRPARRIVLAELGEQVQEIRFGDHPDGFAAFQVEKVPTLLVVKMGGGAILFEGVPTHRQLRGLDP